MSQPESYERKCQGWHSLRMQKSLKEIDERGNKIVKDALGRKVNCRCKKLRQKQAELRWHI